MGVLMSAKIINSNTELNDLVHGAVVVLGPTSKLGDIGKSVGLEDMPSPLAIQKIGEDWFAAGSSQPTPVENFTNAESWPALVVFEVA